MSHNGGNFDQSLLVNFAGVSPAVFDLTFDKDEYERCQDIDECVDNTHDCNHEGGALCKNEDGSFHCECAPGFSILPDGSCTDINECKSHSACRENAICKNTDGDYECECIEGTVFIFKVII